MNKTISSVGMIALSILEGNKSKAYKDVAGVWTIGIGTTKYPDGTPVKEGDTCTLAQSFEYCKNDLNWCYETIYSSVKVELSQNQFDALVIFIYNIGGPSFKKSSLLKKINANPLDESIASEFLKWNKAGGKVVKGLIKRREMEVSIYFSK